MSRSFPAALVAASCLTVLVTAPGSAAPLEPTRATANAVQALAADLAAHPAMEAEDLYKFLHQALFGPGHAIPDESAAAAFLAREIDGLGPPLQEESPCTTLGGDPILVRVHLRWFKESGFDAGALLQAFVATAREVEGDASQMDAALVLVGEFLRRDGRSDLAAALADLGHRMRCEGYPAVHHSERYREAYRPAYRIVAADLAAEHWWCGVTFEQEPAEPR